MNTIEELLAEAERLGKNYPGWECDGSASVCDERLDLIEKLAAALAVSPAPARDDATALRLAAQSYPFTLLGVGTTWREAQKALIERADGIDALPVTEEEPMPTPELKEERRCDAICDGRGGTSGCFTPWCKCTVCH